MQVVIGGDLLDGLHSLDRLKGDSGLELGTVVSSFLLHGLCGVLPPQRPSLKLTISLAPFHPASSDLPPLSLRRAPNNYLTPLWRRVVIESPFCFYCVILKID